MQASFYSYGTATTGSNQNLDTVEDQGSWQQPDAGQNTSWQNQDGVYYTSVISGAPLSYFTDNTTGSTSTMGGVFSRGGKPNTFKSAKLASGNIDMSQTQSCTQYGNNATQFMTYNQFQESTTGNFNNVSSDPSYYVYSGDQYMTNSGNYSNTDPRSGDTTGGNAMVNKSLSVGSSSGMGNDSNGNASIGNNRDSMGMDNAGNGNLTSENFGIVDNRAYNGSSRNLDHQKGHHLGMARHSYNSDYETCSYNNDFYGNGYPSRGHFRGRGDRFQSHQRTSDSVSRGRFNGGTRGDWKSDSGFRNNFVANSYRRGGRGFNSDTHSREVSRSYVSGRGSERGDKSITITLSAAHYNQWCYLRKHFNRRDNELAEHLLDSHDKHCLGCKQKNETKKPTIKRKVSNETEETTATNESDEEELTEEEMQMKRLMGFAGFKSTKGSKPKDSTDTFSAVGCTKNSKEMELQETVSSSTLTVEERKAMASLGGFSVFSKSDAVNAGPVGFGAPAVNFTP
ncbi:hypothetical protein EGW08_023100 [Elysia chlorotica]|uniref:U4/U6.U5 small nuclear ribonucleoprotein 27kDa protein domain-containing protein n=1 Tax=Elysia chlorotica TaxID=188477 RepID=A0A433SJC7_ELYCH|nr:hypothetical protein EGW08_023100 [Elysia chlorotica]